MSNPITWKNLSSGITADTGVNAFNSARQSIRDGFRDISGVISDSEKAYQLADDTRKDNNLADFTQTIRSSFTSPEEFAAGQKDGRVAAMLGKYGKDIDTKAASDLIYNLTPQLQARNEQAIRNTNITNEARDAPIRDKIKLLFNQGKKEEAQALLDANPSLTNQTEVATYGQGQDDRKTKLARDIIEAGQKDATFAADRALDPGRLQAQRDNQLNSAASRASNYASVRASNAQVDNMLSKAQTDKLNALTTSMAAGKAGQALDIATKMKGTTFSEGSMQDRKATEEMLGKFFTANGIKGDAQESIRTELFKKFNNGEYVTKDGLKAPVSLSLLYEKLNQNTDKWNGFLNTGFTGGTGIGNRGTKLVDTITDAIDTDPRHRREGATFNQVMLQNQMKNGAITKEEAISAGDVINKLNASVDGTTKKIGDTSYSATDAEKIQKFADKQGITVNAAGRQLKEKGEVSAYKPTVVNNTSAPVANDPNVPTVNASGQMIGVNKVKVAPDVINTKTGKSTTDGDGVKILGADNKPTTLRLSKIDALESGQLYGEEAGKVLKKILAAGDVTSNITQAADPNKKNTDDKNHGRAIGDLKVTIKGKEYDVGLLMVKLGYAQPAFGGELDKEYTDAYAVAIHEGRGANGTLAGVSQDAGKFKKQQALKKSYADLDALFNLK